MKFLKKIKKFGFVLAVILVLVGSLIGYKIVQAATGGGTATIALDGGFQGAGVTVVQSTSHIFTTILTINSSGMTLAASSPTFTIPDGFTMPTTHAVATAGDVNADGKWSATMITGGGCTVSSNPASSITIASGRVITIDITADCADGDKIVLTYKGTSNVTMGATQLVVSTADAGYTGLVTPLIAGSPTITVTAASADLSLTKTVDNATPSVGGTIVFTVTVTNSGPDAATGVIVGDLLPSGLSWVSDVPSQGDYNWGSGVWTVGAIANGASKTLLVRATVNGADVDTITNTAEITASNEADVDSTNDQDSVDVVVTNNDIPEEVIPTPSESHSSSGSTPTYGCKDPTATNYNYFSASNPALCVYINIPVVTPPVITPLLPNTGFPPEIWYESLLNSFLNLFR